MVPFLLLYCAYAALRAAPWRRVLASLALFAGMGDWPVNVGDMSCCRSGELSKLPKLLGEKVRLDRLVAGPEAPTSVEDPMTELDPLASSASAHLLSLAWLWLHSECGSTCAARDGKGSPPLWLPSPPPSPAATGAGLEAGPQCTSAWAGCPESNMA